MKKYRKISKKELSQILSDHKLWLDSKKKEGNRAVLSNTNLHDANLREANLREANLSEANLREANLSEADLRGAELSGANLGGADLSSADLSSVHLDGAELGGAELSGANLTRASFIYTNIRSSDLTNCIFNSSNMGHTVIIDTDLSEAKGLETVNHSFSSTISIGTIIRSKGKIPQVFLRGCGVPDEWINYIPSLTGQAIQYYSCFISHSSKDKEFATRLYGDLQNNNVRCWYAPEDLKIGDKFSLKIEESIRVYDKLLIILSENSINSDWVEREVEAALEKEKKNNTTVLFPIRIDDAVMDTDLSWAAHIRRTRHIGDFSKWEHHNDFKKAFDRLVKDLKAESNR